MPELENQAPELPSSQATVLVPTPLEIWKGTFKRNLMLAVGLGMDWTILWWYMIDGLLLGASAIEKWWNLWDTMPSKRPLSLWVRVLRRDWGTQPALPLLPGWDHMISFAEQTAFLWPWATINPPLSYFYCVFGHWKVTNMDIDSVLRALVAVYVNTQKSF